MIVPIASPELFSPPIARTGMASCWSLRCVFCVVWSMALSEDGRLLASGGDDGMVRLWQVDTGACLHALRGDRRYQRLDITGLTGVTEAQRAALLALGATDGPRDARVV